MICQVLVEVVQADRPAYRPSARPCEFELSSAAILLMKWIRMCGVTVDLRCVLLHVGLLCEYRRAFELLAKWTRMSVDVLSG